MNGRPGVNGSGGPPDRGGESEEDIDALFAEVRRTAAADGRRHPFINYAPGGTINTGAVQGDQRVENRSGAPGPAGRRVKAREGPIPAAEILEAAFGFAEPAWFPEARAQLDTGILFLTGERGSGRRTAALNLLRRGGGESLALRAVDSDVDLASWAPGDGDTGVRGYLVDGLLPAHALGPGMIGNLRRLLTEADARMVVVLAEDPRLVHALERDLHITPVRCEPPPTRALFDARFAAEVPDPARRARIVAGLAPGLLTELLAADLVPAQVAELVSALVGATGEADTGEGGTGEADITGLRDRLSFLAEREAPELLRSLEGDPEALAFLLATCVFEGHDHRIVREEADRLLVLAAGRLDHTLPAPGGGPGDGQGRALPNPGFALRRSLDDLLRTVGARRAPREIRTGSRFTYTVEPVRFTRHGQAEAVLRHAWRQYGQLSGLLTEWLGAHRDEHDLTEPVGRVIGMAAGWGGGRRALQHIHTLARSDTARGRFIAAYALGMAAADPVLATEVKYRLDDWSGQRGWQVRSTVAYACATDFGAARPGLALRLLRGMFRGLTDHHERTVGRDIRNALLALFASGSQPVVFGVLADWAEHGDPAGELALATFPHLLLADSLWFQEQLLRNGDHTEAIVRLVRRGLADESLFPATRSSLLLWCRLARWNSEQSAAVDTLLTELARDMGVGELRLFVEIDRADQSDLPGRAVAHDALVAWRSGHTAAAGPAPAPPSGGTAHPHGRTP
ncbi:hypothetical protein [Streptomyces yaizuensis]|uniref:ATP-binding protein n=1 Tax=Streptomyces yaizuensis TaxID=2989713 RepID=A0ABQ5NSB1_9ACTN|nr:hypothetical protein [Streptomyces sp. YSPA8]GLF92931.1 hypothetical protein SYYSPA8_01560 [Streptomyces sp. YSPA8]